MRFPWMFEYKWVDESEEHFGHKPADFGRLAYARVTICDKWGRSRQSLYIPMHWFKRPDIARERVGTETPVMCFYSPNLDDMPAFRLPKPIFYWTTPIPRHRINLKVMVDEIHDSDCQPPVRIDQLHVRPSGPVSDAQLLRNRDERQQFRQALENARADSVQSRVNALSVLVGILSKGDRAEFVQHCEPELRDVVRRSLTKRNSPDAAEQAHAVHLVGLLVGLQGFQADDLHELLTVEELLRNRDTPAAVRVRCCSTLVVCLLIGDEDWADKDGRRMEALFDIARDDSEPSDVRVAALRAWTFLLADGWETTEAPYFYCRRLLVMMETVCIAQHATETFAILLECEKESGKSADDLIVGPMLPEIIECLEEKLVKGTQKSIGKASKQRKAFRQLLAFFENGELPEPERITISNDSRQQIVLRSWTQRAMYAELVQCTGSGLLEHFNDERVRASLRLDTEGSLVDHAYRVQRDAQRNGDPKGSAEKIRTGKAKRPNRDREEFWFEEE